MIKIQKNDDGFLAFDSSIEGAFADGKTEVEALANLAEVVEMIEDWKKSRKIPISGVSA